jgi:dTDP-glucose 4,6-dehydratase
MVGGMRYLITGGAGFIGGAFTQKVVNGGDTALNYDKLTYAGNLMNVQDVEGSPNYSFIKGDICDKAALSEAFESFKPDYVVNFAAESHVDRSIMDPDEFISTNVVGVANLLKLSLKHSVKKYVQVSTDEVYGSLEIHGAFREDSPLNPRNPYSASKASGDLLTHAYFETHGLPINITRCGNNYGPRQFPEKLIPLTILNCVNSKKVPVYGDGLQVRDWIHVDDHCSAISMVVKKGVPGEVYNIGCGCERRNLDVVKRIIRLVSERMPEKGIDEGRIEFVKDRKGHDRRYSTDASKLKRELGWKPEISFEEGLALTVDWYLGNRTWVNSVINKDYLEYYRRNYGSGRMEK